MNLIALLRMKFSIECTIFGNDLRMTQKKHSLLVNKRQMDIARAYLEQRPRPARCCCPRGEGCGRKESCSSKDVLKLVYYVVEYRERARESER